MWLHSLLSLLLGGSASSLSPPPSWSPTYSLQGILTIPFAEIQEPFTAWADLAAGKSRIDYYGGMVKTFQRGDLGAHGTMAKVVPMTNEEVTNLMDCFQVDGEAGGAVEAQPMLPDISTFTLLGEELKNGQVCQMWQKEEVIGSKVNKYTMWVRAEAGLAIPVHYEMRGYNSLLGSHYDHYFLSYTDFSPEKPGDGVFDLFLTMTCHGWPGPGAASDHTHTMNPAKEFLGSPETHVRKSFDEFETEHGKRYRDETEREWRLDTYRQNLRYIQSRNRAGLSYSLASNHLADHTGPELRRLRGRTHAPGQRDNGGLAMVVSAGELAAAPDTLDWRIYGAVTPVKDQSVCGSCWSFGTVGTLEGTLFLQTGKLVRLSQQALVDCSWGFGNNGCDGGEDFRAYQWILKHGGIPTEASYGPYLGQDSYCRLEHANMGLKIKGWVNVTSGDRDALKVAIAARGPVSVAIDASHKSLSFYSHGVYYEEKCSSTDLDHAVLAVGYGNIGGEDYWLIKNSWSTYWGNDGYVLMSQKDNNCGVATSATYVVPDMRKGPVP